MADDDEQLSESPVLAGSDEAIASDIQDFRQLLATSDRAGLQSALENPELFRLACDDDRYMQIALHGIAVLAWDEPAAASESLVRFDAAKSREDPESPARQAARSILAALEWRQLEALDIAPVAAMSELRDFLRLYPALGAQGKHADALRADMEDRPMSYAQFFEALAEHAQVLPRWILETETVSSEQKTEEGAGGELGETQREALSIALVELREALKGGVRFYLLWIVVVGLLIALPNASGALAAIVAIGAYMGIGENKSYQTIVRPRLVTLAIQEGVGTKDVVAWIHAGEHKVGRVGSFDIKIENDLTLELLAALSRSIAPTT